jgi:predicted ribosome quality control (RQC) complex YloA/Tae2 family protein
MKIQMKKVSIYVEENDKTYDLLIGQTQRENDQILRACEQNDTWFHLENTSSPHFILQNGGENIPKRYLNQIAGLFTEYKNNLSKRYRVIYTELKNVKLTKTPGQVLTSKTKTIKI